jgi:peptidoglycan/LPS O-acetylase OafA/YrhL
MNKRYEELDSLRGIAALSVFLSHILLVFPDTKATKLLFDYGPLRIFVAGSEAVILFFVLSGFVLSLPFYNSTGVNYLSFLIKRVCRIYIPYIVAVTFSLIFSMTLYSGKILGLSNWFNGFWSNPVNSTTVINHTLLIKTFMSNVNPVLWSLVHEMRISIIFPLLMLVVVRISFKKGMLLSILFSLLSVFLFYVFKKGNNGVEYINTINYIAIFVIGALLAKYRLSISDKLKLLSARSKAILFCFGLLMYVFVKPSFALKALVFHDIAPFYRTVIDCWVVAIGAAILIVFAMTSKVFSRILTNKIIHFLGKISYSLFLSHIFILFSLIHLLYERIPMFLICLISIIMTLIISSFMYVFIEEPSIKLGRFLVNKLNITARQTIKQIEKLAATK